jgi:hypothetical protein
MKKIYTLILLSISISFSAQIEGTWKLDPNAGAMAVSSDSGAAGSVYWSIDAAGVSTRSCGWDDSITFDINGNMDIYKDGLTWIEDWQGTEECNTPISPFVGGNFTYTFTNGTLTTNGTGANIGLSKAYNGGEYSNSTTTFQSSVFYRISFFNNDSSFNADINVGVNWWRFVYSRTSYNPAPPPPAPTHTVTFNVHTDSIAGNVSADGIYIGGGFVGGHDALLLDDSDGDGIWSGSTSLDAAGGLFTILNGNCSNYSCKENIAGEPCGDPANYDDRNHLAGGFSQDTTLTLQYGSCVTPGTSTGIKQVDNNLSIFPNPSNGIITIQAANSINTVNIYNMIGNLVVVKNIANNQATLNIENLTNGVYFMELNLSNGSILNSKFIKK